MKKTLVLVIVAGMLSAWATMAESITIIPGLEGFGTDTRAAYGAANPPEICIVDSLLDTTGNPSWDASSYSVGVFKGTLIQCLEGLDTLNGETIEGHVVLPNSGKIVLFETSGTIKEIANNGDGVSFGYKVGSYTTIAGQTSPNPGILLRNVCIYGGSQHDILIQHLRGRMDGPPSIAYGNHKSFQFPSSADTYNIVVDHISAAWGADGNIGLYKDSAGGELHDITLSNCIMAEGRENMGLINEEASNSKNCLYGGPSSNSDNTYNILVYGNLFSNTKKRNPRVTHGASAVVNNYLYNNAELGIQLIGTDNILIASIVGNVQDGGPMSGTYSSDRMPNYMFGDWDEPLTQHRIYLFDNLADSGAQIDSTDWLSPGFMVDIRPGSGGIEDPTNIYKDIIVDQTDYIKVTGENPSTDAPIWPANLTLMPSIAVKDYIIANAGAYPAFRDSLDTRFINEMINGTGPSSRLQGSPSADDWPVLAANVITLDIPSNPHGDDDADGYTNLEEWLHGLAAEVEGGGSGVAQSPINQTGWSLVYVDSEETEQDSHAVNSFDGDLDTIWHTEWSLTDPDPCHPHEIQIDLGGFYDICGFRYLSRQDEWLNGMIKDYEFYVSSDIADWGAAVASGTWTAGKIEKQVSFDCTLGRYVRLVALSEVSGNPWTTMAELNVLAVQPDSDINNDGKVNIEDFAVIATWWDNENACSSPDWCEGADFDMSGTVDMLDFAYFAENWLRQTW